MKTVRSYNKLVTELINLNLPYRLEIAGYVTYFRKVYPMLALKAISKLANKTIIITAGQHGDEYYAVNILLKWLKQPILFPDLNYFIFPIVNPFGYEKNSRDNGNRQDTNNDVNFVKDSKVAELAILYDQFPQTADLILDIHGDIGKEAMYAYEHKPDTLPSIVEPALLENDVIIPYERNKTIYKCKITNGVIVPPKYDMGIEAYMEKLGVQYTVTLEFPGKFEGQKRAQAGIAIINSVLKNFKGVT